MDVLVQLQSWAHVITNGACSICYYVSMLKELKDGAARPGDDEAASPGRRHLASLRA